MTTIAFDGRYIAAEGRENINGTIVRDDADKFYLNGSKLFVLCGRTSECEKISQSFNAGDKTDYSEAGGFLFDDGVMYLAFVEDDSQKFMQNKLTTKYWADGSGRDWAIAAMDHGKTAVDAVKYAITRDPRSGGIIRCFDTHTGKFIKVKQ